LASQRLTWRYQAFVGGAQDGLHLAFPGPSTVQGLKFVSLLTSQRHQGAMRFTGAETTRALVERVVTRAGSGYYDTMADDQMRRRRQASIAKDTATARRIRRLFRTDYNDE